MIAPKAFISHSSHDKARFVLPFAEKLRARGVEAWLDEWEMLPGDSLVERIFDGGIGQAAAFIVVLSEASLASPWVREELDAGIVNKIERRTKLIPILIEDVEVPQALKATLWERATDFSRIDDVVERVVRAIFGTTSAPPIGPPPGYVVQPQIGGLTSAESVVLGAVCRQAIDQHYRLVMGGPIFAACEAQGLATEAIVDGLEVLADGNYIEDVRWGHTAAAFHCNVTWYGLLAHLEAERPDLAALQQAALAAVLNAPEQDVERGLLATTIGAEPLVVEALMRPFEGDALSIRGYLGGDILFRVRSAAVLRRHLTG